MFKISSRLLLLTGFLVLVCYLSLPNVRNFYFWKDDWIFVWANNFNPVAAYPEIGAPNWQVKTGVLMLPYVRLLGTIPFETFQSVGIYLKVINSIAVLFLVYTFTKNRSASIISSLLYAAYSGGVEVYTWHRITAVAVGSSLFAFSFHNLYIERRKLVYLFAMCGCAAIALLSFFGRGIGMFPLFATSVILHFLLQPSKFLAKYFLFLAAVMSMLVILIRDSAANLTGTSYQEVLSMSYSYKDVLFSNIGNLLRIPLFKLAEEGGLVGSISPLSLVLGQSFFVIVAIVMVVFLIKRSRFWLSMSVSLVWMVLAFVPNWMYASGGPSTMVGSSHRYMAGIGAGVILVIGLLLSRLSRLKQVLAFIPVFITFLGYSVFVVNIENKQRNADFVKPIYQRIMSDTMTDPWPRALIIHTSLPNLTSGWLTYAYSYFKGLPSYSMFPTVFSNQDAAAEWICAPEEKREAIAFKYAAPDYQKGRPILETNIHAWSISLDREITNDTKAFRNRVATCLDQ